MKEFKNLAQFNKLFDTDAKCRKYLELQLWGGKPKCPYCGCDNICRFANGKIFKCRKPECRRKFSVTVGTIYENTKIPLNKWFLAMYLFINHKKGISSLQLSRDLGITQKSAWFLLHRVRELVREKAPHMMEGVIQIDECYVGGKNKNRHGKKKILHSQGRSSKDKTPVVGLYENNGQVKTEVVENTTGDTLNAIIQDNISTDAIVVTDAYEGYSEVDDTHLHVVVNHKQGEYVNEFHFHTNGVENFWSHLKRGIVGIYHSTSKKHLHRYCDEYAYRYNTRQIKDVSRFTVSLQQSRGRLTYKRLVNR